VKYTVNRDVFTGTGVKEQEVEGLPLVENDVYIFGFEVKTPYAIPLRIRATAKL
jgi:hypothetical protein